MSVRSTNLLDVLTSTLTEELFPKGLELIPGLTEVYELQLAHYESRLLSDDDLIRNAAYFASLHGRPTRHVLMCAGEPVRLPEFSSSRLRSFFNTKQFKTGYATHGLFPYRGKFHPQLVKGLINVMGVKAGETLLDPMMGSGTVSVEASLMGIHSIGIDASPFCRLMAQAKLDGLTIPLDPVRNALKNCRSVFRRFSAATPLSRRKGAPQRSVSRDLFDRGVNTGSSMQSQAASGDRHLWANDSRVENVILLACLDSAGYSERSQRQSPEDQFEAVLSRYVFVAEKIQAALSRESFELGEARVFVGDARELPLPPCSVDGILFSPPYSFAIDYLENDAPQLDFLRVDRSALKNTMVGLRGQGKSEKLALFKTDMANVLIECGRVLRPGRLCSVVVGTNNNQLSRLTGTHPDEVQGFDELVVDLGRNAGLTFVRQIDRQITGMANTMRTESIVILRRT